MMNPGDQLRVSMNDSSAGFVGRIDDLTTGESGFMVASKHNGFRQINWDPAGFTCLGSPYAFHPMYATSHTYTHIQTVPNEPVTWAGWTAHT